MKLTNTNNVKAIKPGMTLLELTVVILVLLSLISILFIGARAWKRGSDRAASILLIRNTQQAVRSNANMLGLNPGDSFTVGDVFGPGKFLESDPTESTTVTDADGNVTTTATSHPAGLPYVFVNGSDGAGAVPAVGTLYIVTSGGDDNVYFNPNDVANW